MTRRLERADWLEFGLDVLRRDGEKGLKIEPMVSALKVTRGSFYWHFESLDAFKTALLEAWRVDLNEAQVIALKHMPTQADQIAELFKVALCQPQRLETAMRVWARTDTRVAKVVEEVDAQRVNYLKDVFLKLGFPPIQADARAALMHWAFVGRAVAPHFDDETLSKLAEPLSNLFMQQEEKS